MTTGAHGRGERGMTLIEVMIAGAILLVAMLGFVATSRYAATSNAVAHRRTAMTLLRAELMDRVTVMPRTSPALAALVGYTGASTTLAYVIDSCYGIDAQLLGRNVGYGDQAFACPASTAYRSFVGARRDPATPTWSVGIYVERLPPDGAGCTPATRNQSIACSAADLLLTD